jgi:hypothetical protein
VVCGTARLSIAGKGAEEYGRLGYHGRLMRGGLTRKTPSFRSHPIKSQVVGCGIDTIPACKETIPLLH